MICSGRLTLQTSILGALEASFGIRVLATQADIPLPTHNLHTLELPPP